MKKIIILLLMIILTGCGSEEIILQSRLEVLEYNINTPYKDSISTYSKKSYDVSNVSNMLMEISKDYYSIDEYFFEEGQYLIKEIREEIYNNYNEVIGLVEQNYINTDKTVLAIAIVVEECNNEKKESILKEVHQLIKERVNLELITVIYNEKSDVLKGDITYINTGSIKEIDFRYLYLDSNEVIEIDLETFNTYNKVIENIKDSEVFISGIGLYNNNELEKIIIKVNDNYLENSKILSISESISADIKSFNAKASVSIYYYSNFELKGILENKENQDFDLHLVEG